MNPPELPTPPVALYIIVGILLTAVGLLGLIVTVRCTGLDSFIITRLRNSRLSSSAHFGQHDAGASHTLLAGYRRRYRRRDHRHLNTTSSAAAAAPATAKRLIRGVASGVGGANDRTLHRVGDVDAGRTVGQIDVASGGGHSAVVAGLVGADDPDSGGTCHRLVVPRLSDSSPGTERTGSDAGPGCHARSPLLLSTELADLKDNRQFRGEPGDS